MSDLIHVGDMTENQKNELTNKLKETLIKFAEENHFSGLSEGGSHNLYRAIENAVYEQWLRAQKTRVKYE